MNTTQFTLLVYQWLFAKVIPAIAPATWQQQVIAFYKGDEWLGKIGLFADSLKKDASGNVELKDLKSRLDAIFKINPTFSYPINEPMLVIIDVGPEHTFKFNQADADAFLAYLNGTTTTTEVKL